ERRRAAPPDVRKPVCRLAIVENEIVLDSKLVDLNLTPEAKAEALDYLRAVIAHAPNWVTGPEIGRGIRWDRVRRRLPKALQGLIQTDRRKGNRLHSTAWRK